MDGPRDNPAKWGISDKESPVSYDITNKWNLKKNDTNELISNIETDS